jgi:hypothetical protein
MFSLTTEPVQQIFGEASFWWFLKIPCRLCFEEEGSLLQNSFSLSERLARR